MTFAYFIKQLTRQWLSAMAKNHMAQSLIIQQAPSIQVARQINHSCCELLPQTKDD